MGSGTSNCHSQRYHPLEQARISICHSNDKRVKKRVYLQTFLLEGSIRIRNGYRRPLIELLDDESLKVGYDRYQLRF